MTVHFPDPRHAPADRFFAYGGNLAAGTLLKAYSMGIFPWYTEYSPVLWWSPDPRCILFPDKHKLSRNMRRLLRAGKFNTTFDSGFRQVIQACSQVARPGQDGTWILPEMVEAYCKLHDAGYAHSVEVWLENELVGGLYGVAIGRVFCGESMFSLRPDASKVALAMLVERMKNRQYAFIDCQNPTPHLLKQGAEIIRRDQFLDMLAIAVDAETEIGTWTEKQ